MQLIREQLPNTTVIFTSHQTKISQLADREVDLNSYLPEQN
ncbi:hypothetical protein ABWH69_01355 [Pasteurella multocida]|nr:hypothetical protein [Pasteurella multocida]